MYCFAWACPNDGKNLWYEGQFLWGTGMCIWFVPEVSHIIMLWDFNAKVGIQYIFEPTTGNKNLQEISKLCHIKKSKCQDYNVPAFIIDLDICWKDTIHIAYILTDSRQHSSVLDVWSFRGVYYDSDHYLFVTRVHIMQIRHASFIWRHSNKRLNKAVSKQQHQVNIWNMFTFFKNYKWWYEINTEWKTNGENIDGGILGFYNWSSISHLTKDVQNHYIKGKKPNCAAYRIHAKQMKTMREM
jgi:hypothetical protein